MKYRALQCLQISLGLFDFPLRTLKAESAAFVTGLPVLSAFSESPHCIIYLMYQVRH